MRCPHCHSDHNRVNDSRRRDGTIWRRRVCSDCGAKFTSYEVLASPDEERPNFREVLRRQQTAQKIRQLILEERQPQVATR